MIPKQTKRAKKINNLKLANLFKSVIKMKKPQHGQFIKANKMKTSTILTLAQLMREYQIITYCLSNIDWS